jgi:DNA-binding beta-propeller fold protein YncE
VGHVHRGGDLQGDGEVTQVPLDEANAYFSDPSGVVASPDGRRAYVASGGSDVVTVLDLDWLAAWLARASEAERGDAMENMALSYPVRARPDSDRLQSPAPGAFPGRQPAVRGRTAR